ncbi:MAG: hypothetical protein Kow0031_09550 [Anaerolineae bacterium]
MLAVAVAMAAGFSAVLLLGASSYALAVALAYLGYRAEFEKTRGNHAPD